MPTVNRPQGPVIPNTQTTATNPQASTTQTPSDPTSQGYGSESSFEAGKPSAADAKKIVDDMFWDNMFSQMNAKYKAKMEETRRSWDAEE
ncbi:MAG: hypothetical protein WBV82_24060 [Myxococcaceae bacterium]